MDQHFSIKLISIGFKLVHQLEPAFLNRFHKLTHYMTLHRRTSERETCSIEHLTAAWASEHCPEDSAQSIECLIRARWWLEQVSYNQTISEGFCIWQFNFCLLKSLTFDIKTNKWTEEHSFWHDTSWSFPPILWVSVPAYRPLRTGSIALSEAGQKDWEKIEKGHKISPHQK